MSHDLCFFISGCGRCKVMLPHRWAGVTLLGELELRCSQCGTVKRISREGEAR